MQVSFISVPTLDSLRNHVLEVLCHNDCLDPTQSTLEQAVLVSKGEPCGLIFQVRGPRNLRISAVWAGHEDRILFYDSAGVRVAESRLCDAPDLSMLKNQPVRQAA